MDLLEQQIKDEVIRLPNVEFISTIADQKDSKYFPYHRKKGHPLNSATPCREILIRGKGRRNPLSRRIYGYE